ncbi:MAG: hypothetical protein FWC18_03240 [Cystobacterineae bacterium]|nr:hypothetical protein [Cystobacterineae bacterium]
MLLGFATSPASFASVGLLGLQLTCVMCFCLILIHAFGRSVGTGLMVLLIPFYNVYYALFQFEHRFRGWVVAGFIGCSVAALSLRLLLHAPLPFSWPPPSAPPF